MNKEVPAHLAWIEKTALGLRRRRQASRRKITPSVRPEDTFNIRKEYTLLHLLWTNNNAMPYWELVNELGSLNGRDIQTCRPEARFQIALIQRLIHEGKVTRSSRVLYPITKFIAKVLQQQGKSRKARRTNDLHLTELGEERMRVLFGLPPKPVTSPAPYVRNEKLIGVVDF